MTKTYPVSKRTLFFYVVELISVIAYSYFEGFLGLMWLAVAVSFLGLVPKLIPEKFSSKTAQVFSQICLIISSIAWGYIVMYYLSAAPAVLTTILVFRILGTLISFKAMRDQIIIIAPLLVGFALLKQAGCIPPIAF